MLFCSSRVPFTWASLCHSAIQAGTLHVQSHLDSSRISFAVIAAVQAAEDCT